MLFEPNGNVFESCGLYSHEAIISVYEDGSMYVPVQNCDGACVHLDQGIDVGVTRCVSALGPELNYCNFIMEKGDKIEVGEEKTGGNEDSDGRRCEEESSVNVKNCVNKVCATVESDIWENGEVNESIRIAC